MPPMFQAQSTRKPSLKSIVLRHLGADVPEGVRLGQTHEEQGGSVLLRSKACHLGHGSVAGACRRRPPLFGPRSWQRDDVLDFSEVTMGEIGLISTIAYSW
jgi:hypothetical protein